MAFVDLETEKIYGCDEGSYTWHHEKGHIVFNKSDWGINFIFWKENIFVLLIVSLGFNSLINNFYLKALSLSFTILFVLMYFYEEAWSWGYALKTKRKIKHGIK